MDSRLLPLAKVGEVGENFFHHRTSETLPCQATGKLFCFDWARENIGRYGTPTVQHVELVVISVLAGFAIAFALALLAHRRRWLQPPLLAATGVLYTIPSVAFFFLLLPVTGRGRDTAIIALTAYTLQIIYRNTTVGLANVPAAVKDAARNLGSETVALQTLKSGQISGYPEYASTALTSFFGLEPEEVPADAQGAYEKAKAEFEKEDLTAFPPTPFASANAVGTLRKTAEKEGLKTISDLQGKSENLSLDGSPECRQRIDCLAGLEKYYGLKFKSFTPVDIGLRYTVLEKGQADLSILFTTDAQLSAEKDKFVILEDDKHVFPAGNVIFVTKPAVAKKAGPDYERTIVEVQKGLTLPVMQELDARVELEKQSPAKAAAAYLKEAGYTG